MMKSDQIEVQTLHLSGVITMQARQVLHKLLLNTCPTMHTTRRESLQVKEI